MCLRARILLLALVPAPMSLLGACATHEPARPNVVILYTDDQGYGDCSAFSPDAKFRTPNMDRIAREGMRFTDGHSAGSVCTPSRYALLTGRYAWRLPGGGGVVGADRDCLIEDGRTTVASLLRDNGYSTAVIGKWHLGLQIPGKKGERDWSLPVTDGPLQKGFDTFYGIPASMNFGVLTWFDGDRAIEPASLWTRKKFPDAEITTAPLDYRMAPPYDADPRDGKDIEVAPGFTDVEALRIIADHSVAYIEDHADEPFFLFVSLTSPHLPHCTAPEFRGTSGMGNYGDFLVETDHRVGQVLDALERAGVADDTLVLLTSDNGPENNYKDWSRLYGHESAGGFRGGKRDVYEGGHRVPFAVRWPRSVGAGTTCDAPVGQVDLLATLADVVGAELVDGYGEDSRSFLPELMGESRERTPLIHHGRGRFAVRQGRWKLIFERGGREVGAPAELYDLDADPDESDDRLAEEPEVVSRLRALACSIVGGRAITPVPDAGRLACFRPTFDRYVEVFGVHVLAAPGVPDRRVAHAAAVMAQYIDNDGDGAPDDEDVAETLREVGAFLVMLPNDRDWDVDAIDWDELAAAGFLVGQDLYGEETLPDGPPHRPGPGRFDATLEEVWHLVGRGWELTYPDAFGTMPGSALANAMDVARGGQFIEIPDEVPDGSWYHYDDDTCDYECMASEYFYWCLTSLLGGQDFQGRAEEIAHEWELSSPDAFTTGDPAAFALLTDPRYRLPRRLPGGIDAD